MQTKTALARVLDSTKQRAAYDDVVKRILSTKHLLAWIMKGCVSEYRNYSVREIAENFIEGEPQVSSAAVHREDHGGVIHGLDTVDKSHEEHTTLYDVLFYATLPGSDETIGLFINVEAQNKYNPGYPLVKRGIYYCSRLLAAQFGRDFADGHYEKLKKVYSIWICANAPDSRDNTITQYALAETSILGNAFEERINYDLLSVVMVCFNDHRLGEYLEDGCDGEAPADLVRLLRMLLSAKLESNEKKQILSEEYDIPMTRKLEDEVIEMCNLSRGVWEQGLQQGIFNIVIKMLKKAKPVEEIMELTDLTLEQIEEIARDNGLELVKE